MRDKKHFNTTVDGRASRVCGTGWQAFSLYHETEDKGQQVKESRSTQPDGMNASGKQDLEVECCEGARKVPKFTTRVELHDSKDYEKLHTAMKNEGFSQTIKWDGDDNTYHLPTAEYTCGGDALTKDEVLASAKKAAVTVAKEYSVLVTQSDGPRKQYGLKVVKPPVKVTFKKS